MAFIQQTAPTAKQQADQSALRLINMMKIECKRQFELSWQKRVEGKLEDKTVAEAQEFFDSYEDKASLAFLIHGKLQDLIYSADDSWKPLIPPHNYEFNQDGTVVISAK